MCSSPICLHSLKLTLTSTVVNDFRIRQVALSRWPLERYTTLKTGLNKSTEHNASQRQFLGLDLEGHL